MTVPQLRPFRFILVGIGPHAKRTFVKHFQDLKAEGRGEIVVAVDITANQVALEQYAIKHLPDTELVFVPHFRDVMPTIVQERLNEVVRRLEIDCVIVSTDPECHKPYGLWAVGLDLHVIMDKPISTRRNACNDPTQAAGIANDYEQLLDAYHELQKRKRTMFLINSHRRYHPGFLGTRDFISNIRDKTSCPVTSLISTHCDGQWRLPDEIVDQHYHPFRYGYGKVSHSGYHFLDTGYKFFEAGWTPQKRPDEVEVVATFVLPNDYMSSLSHEEHARALGGDAYNSFAKYGPGELRMRMEDMGEIDAMLQITFKKHGNVLGIAQLNLLHTGFSRRDWIDQGPTPDLYKGCGRVKHEAHEVRSGPFQTIVIDSRQANDKHDRSKPSTAELGSDNHFEVQTWRNCGILGEKEPLKTYTVNELDNRYNTKAQGIYMENIKRGILWEALEFLEGRTTVDDLTSNLPDHSVPANLMSATYMSHLRRTRGLNPVTHIDISYSSGTARATMREDDLIVSPYSPLQHSAPLTPPDDRDLPEYSHCHDAAKVSVDGPRWDAYLVAQQTSPLT
ncbi:hypothetical protein DOTSEDRAFT_91360 [Dothistroma septosporum NZE10]|uniref:Gfo/Idh/MocA-like oxidoreductase N-terminal domain-containing protein n=1 Tax=Dothistroma septosporum (strain NZE10 / CBS 128990) TaxID=675120 RepID=N1PFJ8_DOTSN|nr:hypothetical protein DOTSEDRAFT_91360 [Dothistroma septosporum NZE10]